MKILVVSDTHGRLENFKKAVERVGKIDHLFHCGDCEGQEDEIRKIAGVPCTIVRGNNDYGSKCPLETIEELGGHRFYVTHGHRLSVSWDTDRLRERAKTFGCDVALYGHIHRPLIDQSDLALTVVNPGSLTFPRQENRLPSYAVIEITPKGDLLVSINYITGRRGMRRW